MCFLGSAYIFTVDVGQRGSERLIEHESLSPLTNQLVVAKNELSGAIIPKPYVSVSDVLAANPNHAEALRIRASAYALDGRYLACASDIEALEQLPAFEFPSPSPILVSAMFHAAVRVKSDALAAVDDGSFSHAKLLLSKSMRYASLAERLGSLEAVSNLCVTLQTWSMRLDRMADAPEEGSYDMDVRKWTSADKKFSAKARFITVAEGKVSLERDNGVRCTISIHQLSAIDREWIAKVERRDQLFSNRPN